MLEISYMQLALRCMILVLEFGNNVVTGFWRRWARIRILVLLIGGFIGHLILPLVEVLILVD